MTLLVSLLKVLRKSADNQHQSGSLYIVTITFTESSRKRKKSIRDELDCKSSPSALHPIDSIAEDADAKSKKKKARTTFTGRQIFELEKQFEMKKYLSSTERSEMAKLLNVTETQVG